MNVLLLGLGNMGFAITKVLCTNKSFVVHVCTPHNRFKKETAGLPLRVHHTLKKSLVASSQVIIVCVKPRKVNEVLQTIAPYLNTKKTLVISVAAGVSNSAIVKKLKQSSPPQVVRFMPNLAVQKKQGITAVCPAKQTTKAFVLRALKVAKTLGKCVEIEEDLMDTFTALSGSGIAFVAAFIDALTKAGIDEGMEPSQAYRTCLQTVKGVISLLEESTSVSPLFNSPESLIAAVSSPQGTTVAGLKVLHSLTNKGSFFDIVKKAVHTSSKKSKHIY